MQLSRNDEIQAIDMQKKDIIQAIDLQKTRYRLQDLLKTKTCKMGTTCPRNRQDYLAMAQQTMHSQKQPSQTTYTCTTTRFDCNIHYH